MAGVRETAPGSNNTMVFWSVFLLGCLTFLPLSSAQHQCSKFSASETLEIGAAENGGFLPVELHIRNNIKGEIEILDADPGSDAIRIEIDKAGASEDIVNNIATNEASFDVGKRNVYVLQVDYQERSVVLAPLVIGSVLGVLLFLILVTLLVWWVFRQRRQQQQFTPVATPHTSSMPLEPSDNTKGAEGRVIGNEGASNSVVVSQIEPKCPPPPPPRRTENIYSTQPKSSTRGEGRRAGGGGVGSPRGISKTTMVTMSVVMVISLAYATCVSQPRVRILIFVPAVSQLDSIKLFFNVAHKGLVFTHRWSRRNSTHLSTFDLEDAGLTEKVPCSAEHLCPSAFIQNLAGCDTATGACVCERGYQLSKGICVDIDECGSGLHACPSAATCQNTIGSYVCRCGYGFYGADGTCKVCSVGCPAGLYESKPCTNFGDRSCSECSRCNGSMYEARPCRGNIDRQCMHVAHPTLVSNQESMPTFLEGLKVTSTKNVFMENLHATRNLETTYYVTDNTQALDFVWDRESGLQVHIGIHSLKLIPEYEDVTHESDNRYVLQSPPTSVDTNKFRKILRSSCRHPIPDYYSISVEIARDRITTASEVVCDSGNSQKMPCPDGFNDGDTYLHRSINEACHKMGTFPDPLMPAANSIVCTKNTALLREIFNQSYPDEQPIRFPSKRCRPAMSRCNQCLNQLRCKMIDIFDQQCCQVDCYTLRDCKVAKSRHCTNSPVECAMGDAYRYTIQPNFRHFDQFQCHIQRRPPEILYIMFYHIKVPGPEGPESELETPRVYKTVYAHDSQFQSRGEFQADYISVEHIAGLNLKDEFILNGKEYVGYRNTKRMNYTVFPTKSAEEYSKKKISVHEIANNVFVATTQFVKPFAYSTTSWVMGNDCNKDVSRFRSQQKHYREEGQNVRAIIDATDDPFHYYLKSVENPPHIRFMVPGNTSVLPWYFREKGPTLVANDSLKISLELISDGRIWNIHVAGLMSACPGYLGIVIVDLMEEEELFRYDTLVFCPKHFNITFNVPNIGRRAEKTFDVRLEDAKRTHHVYLTHLLFESTEYNEPKSQRKTDLPAPTNNPWPVIVVFIATTSLILLLLNFAYAYFEFTKVRALYKKKQENYYQRTAEDRDIAIVNKSSNTLSQKQYAFIVAYIAFRVLYSLIFTFTVFLGILGVALQNDVLQLSGIQEFQKRKYNESKSLAQEIEKYGQDELLRQAELVTNMQGACSNYIEELFDAMLFQVDNITLNLHHHQMYGPTTSISSLMHNWFHHKVNRYDARLLEYSKHYRKNFTRKVNPTAKSYGKYLGKLHRNQWFQFAELLYNKSHFGDKRPEIFRSSMLSGVDADFGAFLHVEEVEDVQLWPLQFWDSYYMMLPTVKKFPAPRVDVGQPTCDFPPDIRFSNMTMMASSNRHINSSRFMAPNLPGLQVRGPKVRMTNTHEEYRYLVPPEPAPDKVDLFSFDEMTESLSLGLLKLLFVVLDIIVLLYRCSRTFMVARTLCQGFDETRMLSGKDAKIKQSEHKKMEERRLFDSRNTDPAGNATDHMIPDYITTLESHRRMLPTSVPNCSNSTQNGNKMAHHYAATSTTGGATWSPAIKSNANCKDTILKILQSSTIPKLVMGILMVVLFCYIVDIVLIVISAEAMEEMHAFQMFLVGLDVQVNRTNWYLTEQAKHFNNITMNIYRGQMTSELLHFQSMVEYFNAEQQRIIENYVSEACAIRRNFLGNRSCDISLQPTILQVPMMPCNFIPIQPQLYTDLENRFADLHLGQHLEPILSAARNIFLKSGYAVLIVAAIMLILHLSGVVLFHFLKTRHKFPVHRTYVTSIPDVALQTSKHTQDGSENESDEEEEEEEEEESELKTYSQHVTTESPDKLKSLLANFKYSETKV